MSEQAIQGGGFLLYKTDANNVFIPESWDEEERMVAQMCEDFLEAEVNPKLDAIDDMEEGLMASLIEKAGELGLLSISLPEEYGGLGKDFRTAMLVTEKLGAGHSFAVAFAAHTGIGTLPILYYGTAEQKEKYLPKLASGEWKGAYCLTEPDSGSDANAAKSRAKLNEAGTHYILNGQKMWITNAGFADVFIVFAKIDDDKKLSAFIIEKSFPGLSLGAEERKMGIKGSSTRQVFFTECEVPVENLLAEREEGFKIAVNILNLGRIKLGGAALGGAKAVVHQSVKYSKERIQFGKSIQEFGAIQHKLAEQAIKTYVTESATYRSSHDVQLAIERLMSEGLSEEDAKLKAMEEFSIEAAIVKVHASEALDFVADEGVQIYGGMGYSAEAPMERSYRDSRINRIFEGTNEINRLLTFDMMVRKAMKGTLPLLGAAQKVAKEMMAIPDFSQEKTTDPVALGLETVEGFKKAVLLISGAALQKYMQGIADHQELIMYIADMLIEVYAAESVLLRVQKIKNQSIEDAHYEEKVLMAEVYTYEAALKIAQWGQKAIAAFAEGDEGRMMQMALRRFTKVDPMDVITKRRAIAKPMMEADKYVYS